MGIEMPTEITYYYECSYGDYRLVYHIPKGIVTTMVEKGEIKKEAKQDFPDGIDINCSQAEYDAFEAAYGYRPSLNPKQLDRAFLGLFSSLDLDVPWKEFVGSGYIKASRLESFSKDVEGSLKELKVKLPEAISISKRYGMAVKRSAMIEKIKQQAVVENTLEEISPEIIEREFKSKRPPTRESLRPKMSKGDSPGVVFSRAQRNLRRK